MLRRIIILIWVIKSYPISNSTIKWISPSVWKSTYEKTTSFLTINSLAKLNFRSSVWILIYSWKIMAKKSLKNSVKKTTKRSFSCLFGLSLQIPTKKLQNSVDRPYFLLVRKLMSKEENKFCPISKKSFED